ncbi:MAG: glycosyltransferase family 4 protein [Opitutaceae bacterium]|nr:glycosyltransferase family 4 protein [Opitutaceae bacterium]
MTHRLEFGRHLVRQGWEVLVATRVNGDEHRARIEAAGLRVVPMPVERGRLLAWRDARYLWRLFRLYRRERPTIVHHVAMKPVLYGSLAALGCRRASVVNTLAGLGHLFTSERKRVRLVRRAVLAVFRRCFARERTRVILQNAEDFALFREFLGARAGNLRLVRGAGVDPARHRVVAHGPRAEAVAVMASRLLRDKGVMDLIEAARRLRAGRVPLRVRIVGGTDPDNPTSLTTEELEALRSEGAVEFTGARPDVAEIYAAADVAVLPSYREGLPRALIEAAASGLPIVTTDTSGCREVVAHGENGLLVPVRDPGALAEALRTLALDPALRARLGAAGRKRVEQEFSQAIVFAEIAAIYAELARA